MIRRILRYGFPLLLLAGVAAWLLGSRFDTQYAYIEDQLLPRNTEVLDLRGQRLTEPGDLAILRRLETLDLRDTGLTEAQYLGLRRALPKCRILWTVPFQGGYVDMDTTALTVDMLTEEDARMLGYLESLETLEIRNSRDYGLLLELKQSRPGLELRFSVELCGRSYPWNVRELTLENADGQLLDKVLPLLPELKYVALRGALPESQIIQSWMRAYPNVTFEWQFEVCGVAASSLDTKLILNDIPLESVAEVEDALANFYDLQWVEMCNCGISSEEMDALWKRHPETRFVWVVHVGLCTLRTDAVSFMPYQFGYDGNRKLWDSQTGELKYCVDLVCLDMGHMGITDYSFLEYMPKLKYLILADTHGTDFSALAGLKELVFLEIFMTRFNQAEVLTGLTKLEDLNIGNSRLDDIEPLLEMTWLKRLWLPGNVLLSHNERRKIVEALPDTVVMYACAGSTGEGWRESPNYYAMRDMLNMGYSPGW